MIGLLLAAGLGRRYGTPKALVDTGTGPWVLRALDVLGGCDATIVVAGARAVEVAALVGSRSTVVVNPAFADGMASSVRVGVDAVPDDADAVLVMLVDLPDVGRVVADRLVAAAGDDPRAQILRASYRGRPGHPVLIGADHLTAFRDSLDSGGPDEGGAQYLRTHGVVPIECGDLADGTDVDSPLPTAGRGCR